MISALITFITLFAVLVIYLLFCVELRACLQYLHIDDRFVFVPVYNMWLYLQLGDDYDDGKFTIRDDITVPRVLVYGIYVAFVAILVLFSVLNLLLDPFIISIMFLLFMMNLSVAGTAYGVYFYEGFQLNERTLSVICSSFLGSLPCIYLGRYLILRQFKKACKHESSNSQSDM